VHHLNNGSSSYFMYMQLDKECDNKILTGNITIAIDQMHLCLFAIHKFNDYLGSGYSMPKSHIKF
jgi:hypothetical protein